MSNGFKPILPERIDFNGNPVEKDQGFKPFAADGTPTTYVPENSGLVGDIMGAPNADEFDFRVTSYMDPYEVRAKRQTTASKWGNASVKMLGLAGTTAIDGTLGTIVGLGNGVASMAKGGGFGEGFINNPVSAALYDFSKKMEKELPNYYTRKEQHSPWYNNLGTANFWADTMLKNTGFAIGAYLSGMGVSRGFDALTSGLTKKAAKNIAGRMAKQLGKNEDEVLKMMKAGELPTDQLLAELQKDARLLKGINTTNQIASSTMGAIGESRIEALHMYHDTIDKLKKENPGLSPEEANKQAVSAANMVFGLDLVTLSLGNYSQFRNAFSRGYEVNKRSMNAIQRSADDKLYKATGGRLEKAKNIGAIALNPATEGLEEMQQFFNTSFSEKFMELENDPEARNYIDNTVEALMYGFSESYGNIDSYDNFFAGFVTGGLGMPGVGSKDGKAQFQMQGGVFEGIRDYKERNKNTDTAIKNLNEFMQDPEYQKKLAFLTRDISLERTKQVALANEDLFNFKNAEDDQFLNMVLSFADAGKLDDLKSDIEGLASMEVSDYRDLMSVDTKNLPDNIKKELAEDQEKYDIFEGVEDSKIKEMLSTRATMMKEDINKILDIRDDLEIKAGNKINRALIPNLVHYAYTIERGQKRLADIKSTVLNELSKTFTTPIQTEAPLDTYGFVIDSSFDGQTKRVLRILKEGETAIAEKSLTEEEKKQLKEKQAEADKNKKAQLVSKREKPDTKGTSLFNFSILETGDESMFMEAFDNFAKENPFAADKIREDVMDAVKMSQRLRTFTELYTETYRNNQSPEIKQRTYAESLARLEQYKKDKALESFRVGTIVSYKDPKTGRTFQYEIFSYDTKKGQTKFVLNEYIPNVGRDARKKKIVTLEELMGDDFSLVDGMQGIERFKIDFNEVNAYKLETKKQAVYGYVLDKRGKRVLVRVNEADKKAGRVINKKDLTKAEKALMDKKNAKEPLVFKNLFGRSEKLLNRFFDPTLRDKLNKAVDLLNELAPNQFDAPLQSQLERIAGLFYTSTEDGNLGYLASMYTFSSLDAIESRLDDINNIYVREILRDKIAERKEDIRESKKQIIKDFGLAIDIMWGELTARDAALDAESARFAQKMADFEKQINEMSLKEIADAKSIAYAKRAITALKKNLEKALKEGDTQTADKLLDILIGYESKIKQLSRGIQESKEAIASMRKILESEKEQIKKIKEDLAKYERAIERLQEHRADLDKDVKFFSLDETMEIIEDLLPETVFTDEFEKRVYDLQSLGLSTQDKIDFLTKEAQQAVPESQKLIDLREASEEADAAVKTEEAIQSRMPSTPEGADRIRDLRRKAEAAKQAYVEQLEEERPYTQDRNDQATSVKSSIYKKAGLEYNEPSNQVVFPKEASSATRKEMIKEAKKAEPSLDWEGMNDDMLIQEYIRLQRRKVAGLGKDKFTTLFVKTGKKSEVNLSAEEAYAQRVEGLRALGVPIEDAISLEDLRALHKTVDAEVKAREGAIKTMEEMLDSVEGVIKTLEQNLDALDADTPAALQKADKIIETLFKFQAQRDTLIQRLALISEGLQTSRQKRAELADLEHRKELMDFLEVMKNARAKVTKKEVKKTSSKKSKQDDPTAESDTPDSIETAGSISSPGELETEEGTKTVQGSHKESAKPAYWEVFNRNSGSDLPGDKPNEIASQRRFHRWLQNNPDVAKDSKVELFQFNDKYNLPQEDIEGFDQENVIWGTVITYEDGKKKYVEADGKLSDTFDSSKALYFTMQDPSIEEGEYGLKWRESSKKEIAKRFGLDHREVTDEDIDTLKEKELQDLKDKFKALRSSWIAQIERGGDNPIINISEVTQGVPIEDAGIPPSTIKEFFGHNDVEVRIATGDLLEIGGRTTKTSPGHAVAIDRKTGDFVRIRPRKLADGEINTVVNIFKTYAKRHSRNAGDKNIVPNSDAHILLKPDGTEIDPASANLFSMLNDIVWWQGNNKKAKDGSEINTNNDTRFHFVSKSGVPGGMIQIGKEKYPFLGARKDEKGNEVFELNPDVETAIRAFLLNKHRQITSRRFNRKNINKKYTHVSAIKNENGIVQRDDVKEYDTYKDYIIEDKSEGQQPLAGVQMKKADKPLTVQGYDDKGATITFANRRLVFDYELSSFRDEELKKNTATRKNAAKNTVIKKKKKKKTQKAQDRPKQKKKESNDNPDVDSGVSPNEALFAGLMDAAASGDTDAFNTLDVNIGKTGKTDKKARGRSRRITDAVFSGRENTNEMEKWFRSKFPSSVEFKRTLDLVNGNSWGEFVDGVVTVVENAAEGTTFHEAFHVVMSEFLSPAEYKAVIEEFLQRPNAEQLIEEKAKTYSDYTREGIIEEILADEFAEYELSEGTKKIPSPAQKSFFEKLLNWIKNLFGVGAPSIHDVYDKLSSGYYAEAKPNGSPKRGIGGKQRRFDRESSPLTNEFIKVVNRKFFVYANDDFRAEFDSYLAGDVSKSGVLNKIYNAVKEEMEEVADAMRQEIKDKEEGFEITQRQLSNLERFLEKWDVNEAYTDKIDQIRYSFKEFHRTQVLSRFDVFTELDIDEIKDEESKDSGSNTWDFNSMTRSAIESSSRRLKLFLAGMPETFKGERYSEAIPSEEFGFSKAMSFGKAFSIYSNLLAGSRTIEEAYRRIVDARETTPGAEFLIKELRLKEFFSSDSKTGVTHSEFQLITDFAQAFNLQKMDYNIGLVGKSGSGAVINASQDTQKRRIINQFRGDERLSAVVGSDYVTIDPNTDRVVYTGLQPVTDLRGTAKEVDAKKRQVYRAVGIEFTDEVWNAIPEDSDAKKLQNVETILNKMTKGNQSIYEKDSGMSVQLGLLTDEIVKADPGQSENSHLNSDGNRVYDNILHNFTSFISNGINKVETRDQLLEEYPFFKSAYVANSKLLKLGGILFDEKGNKKNTTGIKIHLGEGARTESREAKKDFSGMTPTERFKFVLDMASQNKFMLTRAGSNSNERFISFGEDTLRSEETVTYNNVTVDRLTADMIGYATDELAYIAEMRSMSKQYSFAKKFEDANTAIASSPVLRIITKDADIRKIVVDLINSKNTSTEMIDAIDIKLFAENNGDIFNKVENLIKNEITEEAERLAEKAIKLNLVKEKRSGVYVNYGVPETDLNGTMREVVSFTNKDSLIRSMRKFASSFMVAQLEQQKVFAGHPAQYVKEVEEADGTLDMSVDNMIKRMSGMVGPKKASAVDTKWWRNIERLFPNLGGMSRLYMDKDGNINETLTEESKPVLKTLILEDIAAQNEELARIFEDYSDMTEADAQGYVHLDTYRDILLTNGMWNLGLEKLYQWEMSNRTPTTFKWNGELVTVASEEDLINEAGKQVSFNPLKPQYFGPLAEVGYISSMYKLSVMPLIPSVIGTKNLDKLNSFMSVNNAGMVVYESGNKVGTSVKEDGSLTKFYDEGGKVGLNVANPSYNLPFQHIYYEFFGIQVSTGNTRKEKTAYGSQPHKQIMYEVYDGVEYRSMSFPELGVNEASPEATEREMNKYLDLVGARIRMGVSSLRRRLGMVKDSQGRLVIEDVDKTIGLLKELVKERDLPQEYIKAFDSLKVDGKVTPMGITVMPAKGDIERALFAIADKMTIKSKMKGTGLIQVASTGWEEVDVTRNYSDGKLDSNQLEFYQNKEGRVTRMQVYVPHYFKEILGDIKEGENVILDPRLKELLGFRIPTSGLNSIDAIEIAGFLPSHAGDMIVLPTEIVAKAGSDYDVDKLTVYYPHYTVSKNADGTTELRYLDFYTEEEINRDPNKEAELKNRVRNQIIADDPNLRKKIEEIKSEYDTKYIDDLKAQKKEVYSDFMKGDAVKDFIEKFNLNPNRTNKRDLENKYRGLVRSFSLLKKLKSNLSKEDGEAKMAFTNEMYFLEVEDPILVATKFREDVSNDEALDVIDELLGTIRGLGSALEAYVEQDPNKIRKTIQDEIDQLSQEMNERISDLVKPEIDAAFAEMDIYEKNGKKAVENQINRSMQGIVLSPENYERLIEPIGSGILKNLSEDIKKLKGQDTVTDTVEDLLHLSWGMETTERYLQGKKGVGIGALQINNEVLAQKAEWSINEDHNLTTYDPSTQKYENFDAILKLDNNNLGGAPKLFGNTTVTSDSAEDASKLRLLNNFLNAYVDIEADPFIIDINAGLDMASTIMFMVRAGVPIRTALYFANQPIVVDYMDSIRAGTNNMVTISNLAPEDRPTKRGIADDIYTKYSDYGAVSPSEIDIISQESLEKYLDPANQKMSDEKFRADQLLILKEFLKMQAMGNELSNALNAVNFDTKGTGGLAAVSIVRNMTMKKLRKNNFIDGLNNVFTSENYMKEFKRAIDSIPEMYKPLFTEFNNSLASNMIEKQFEKYYEDAFITFDAKVNMIDIFMHDMVHSLVMLAPINSKTTATLTDQIRNLLVSEGKNVSVARNLKDFKTAFPDIAKENAFISRLQPIFNDNGGDRVHMLDQPTEATDVDDVIDGWRELIRSTNPRIRSFANDLIKLSIIQTGFRNHSIGFTKYVPSENLSVIVNNAYDFYRSMGIHGKRKFKNFAMMDSIIANYNNNDILPRNARVGLNMSYLLKGEYTGKDNDKKLQEAKAAGLEVWNKRLSTRYSKKVGDIYEDRVIQIFSDQGLKTIPLKEFMEMYMKHKRRGRLKMFTELSNKLILKGGFHGRMRGAAPSDLPILDKVPNVTPEKVDDATEKTKKYKGKKKVKKNKERNGDQDTCKK